MRASSAVNHKLRRRFASYADRSERSISGGSPRAMFDQVARRERKNSMVLSQAKNFAPVEPERFQVAMRSILSGASSAPANAHTHRSSYTFIGGVFVFASVPAPGVRRWRREPRARHLDTGGRPRLDEHTTPGKTLRKRSPKKNSKSRVRAFQPAEHNSRLELGKNKATIRTCALQYHPLPHL
jgi:hypothetical protein